MLVLAVIDAVFVEERHQALEELAQIMDKTENKRRLTVCLDTCHIHDGGYDVVNDFDGVLEQFDKTVGLNRLAVIHLNHSKNPRGAGKDRHALVGAGMIGFNAMQYVVYHPSLAHLPMVLETPWIGKEDGKERPMYEAEITLLRGDTQKRFGVERLDYFFKKQDIHHRDFILNTCDLLKNDPKAKKEDKREPMERLYDLVAAEKLFPELTEEQINHRITAWFAGKEALVGA